MLDIDWITSDKLVPYPEALSFMEERIAGIHAGTSPETVWLLEHPPLYTAGTSADPSELVDPERFDVFETGRGGRYTYHGPGQRVGYVMLDLKKRGGDVRAYVYNLEEWIIRSLADVGVIGERREGRVGIWVVNDKDSLNEPCENKIAAIGVRIRHWVTYHGISVNVSPELEHFDGIIPCGIDEFGVTSLKKLNIPVDLGGFDQSLKRNFSIVFE